tara:strand:+ start:974 stop:1357 length:384 start_codon:yes stop_codon:yes gene_type:complete
VNKMVNDPALQELVNKYDHVFNFNFLVYGDLKEEEVGLLTKGLIVMISSQLTTAQHGEAVLLFDPISEETAVLHGTFQGTSLNVIYASSVIVEEKILNLVEATILDGLSFLRYKADFQGMTRSVSYV